MSGFIGRGELGGVCVTVHGVRSEDGRDGNGVGIDEWVHWIPPSVIGFDSRADYRARITHSGWTPLEDDRDEIMVSLFTHGL